MSSPRLVNQNATLSQHGTKTSNLVWEQWSPHKAATPDKQETEDANWSHSCSPCRAPRRPSKTPNGENPLFPRLNHAIRKQTGLTSAERPGTYAKKTKQAKTIKTIQFQTKMVRNCANTGNKTNMYTTQQKITKKISIIFNALIIYVR